MILSCLTHSGGCLALQAPGSILQCSVAAWCLLREGQLRHVASSSCRTSSPSGCLKHLGPLLTDHHQHQQSSTPSASADSLYQSVLGSLAHKQQQLSSSTTTTACLHHAAVQDVDSGSDEDTSSQQGPQGPALRAEHQHQQRHIHHMVHHQHGAQHYPGHTSHHSNRYPGQLHAPHMHGRRHAASQSQVDKFISEQLLSCKSLGMLRRIMIKHKGTMDPAHVADTLLCLQHLVRAARMARQAGGARLAAAYTHHGTSLARSQPRVRAAWELARSKPRAAESDGHMEQLMAQMLGDLGNMIWFMMGDMTGPDLAKLLYSWATLDWHPEPELLADVKASFIAAAASGGTQPHNQQHQQASEQPEQQQQQESRLQQWPELGLWQEPWLAAGMWGLAKLGEPFRGQVLLLLEQYWRELLPYWTPQQLADIAAVLAAAADDQMTAAAVATDVTEEEGQQLVLDGLQHQLVPIVLGLSHRLVQVLRQQQGQGGNAEWEDAGVQAHEPYVPVPWPESMLLRVQSALRASSSGGVQGAAASAPNASEGQDAAAGSGGVPMMPVHNVQGLAWRMLQSLAAVGVNVSEPEKQAVGAVVAELAAATKGASRQS